jgi:hypothetical protein
VARHVVPARDPFVEAGLQPGSSSSLATAFRFLATRHSPLPLNMLDPHRQPWHHVDTMFLQGGDNRL